VVHAIFEVFVACVELASWLKKCVIADPLDTRSHYFGRVSSNCAVLVGEPLGDDGMRGDDAFAWNACSLSDVSPFTYPHMIADKHAIGFVEELAAFQIEDHVGVLSASDGDGAGKKTIVANLASISAGMQQESTATLDGEIRSDLERCPVSSSVCPALNDETVRAEPISDHDGVATAMYVEADGCP
jgi:hypothetical protein